MHSLDQTFAQPALAPEPALEACHPPVIPLVIIAKQVQQAVQREDPQLNLERVARVARLAPGNAGRNDDVAKKCVL